MNDNDDAHEHTVNLLAENHRLREALEVIVGKIRTEDEMIDIAETALASTEAALSVCRCPECAEPERHVLGVGFISSITQSVGAVNIKLRERSLPVPLQMPLQLAMVPARGRSQSS